MLIFPKGENEFNKAGFRPLKVKWFNRPRVAEAPVSFECEVDRILPLGDGPGAGNLVLAKVVMMHVETAFLTEENTLAGEQLDLVARMGDQWYTKVNSKSLFKLSKSLARVGIGLPPFHKAFKQVIF